MNTRKHWNLLWLCVGACCLCSASRAASQENEPGDLRLPEVVITGIDESKIQRPIPKVELLPASFLVINASCRDEADELAQQAALAALLQPRRAEKLYQQAIAVDPPLLGVFDVVVNDEQIHCGNELEVADIREKIGLHDRHFHPAP